MRKLQSCRSTEVGLRESRYDARFYFHGMESPRSHRRPESKTWVIELKYILERWKTAVANSGVAARKDVETETSKSLYAC